MSLCQLARFLPSFLRASERFSRERSFSTVRHFVSLSLSRLYVLYTGRDDGVRPAEEICGALIDAIRDVEREGERLWKGNSLAINKNRWRVRAGRLFGACGVASWWRLFAEEERFEGR